MSQSIPDGVSNHMNKYVGGVKVILSGRHGLV